MSDPRRAFDLTVWFYTTDWPIPHGFQRADSENRNTLRLGPLCIAWAFERESVDSRG